MGWCSVRSPSCSLTVGTSDTGLPHRAIHPPDHPGWETQGNKGGALQETPKFQYLIIVMGREHSPRVWPGAPLSPRAEEHEKNIYEMTVIPSPPVSIFPWWYAAINIFQISLMSFKKNFYHEPVFYLYFRRFLFHLFVWWSPNCHRCFSIFFYI